MRDALAILHRLRTHRKKGAEQAFMEAEGRRRDAETRVEDMESRVTDSREAVQDTDEACWVAQAQAWRLKMELAIRRERGRLAERTREAGNQQVVLARATRDARVVEKVIENIDERRAATVRRNEARRLDAMGTSRWRRKGV